MTAVLTANIENCSVEGLWPGGGVRVRTDGSEASDRVMPDDWRLVKFEDSEGLTVTFVLFVEENLQNTLGIFHRGDDGTSDVWSPARQKCCSLSTGIGGRGPSVCLAPLHTSVDR